MIIFSKSKFFLALLFLFFLFSYFAISSKNQGVIIIENKNDDLKESQNSTSVFTNLEYKFQNDTGKTFSLKGKKAIVKKDNPEIVILYNVTFYTILKDSTVLKITSNEAEFNKSEKNIFFYKNFFLINKDISISSKKGKFYNNKKTLEILDNVILKNTKNTIKCDKLIYNTSTKNIELTMNSKTEQIYGIRKK